MSLIWQRFTEEELRDIVENAVRFARHTTEGNVSNEAVVQRALKEEFIDGHWVSAFFLHPYPGSVRRAIELLKTD